MAQGKIEGGAKQGGGGVIEHPEGQHKVPGFAVVHVIAARAAGQGFKPIPQTPHLVDGAEN